MVALWNAYSSEVAAREAAEALRRLGLPGRAIRLVTGARRHDVRRERVGGFARSIGPHSDVGSFGGVRRRRAQGAGSFVGDADRQRQGSFADVDRVAMTEYDDDGAEHSRVIGHPALRRLLRAVLPDSGSELLIDALQSRKTVVLVEAADVTVSDDEPLLEALMNEPVGGLPRA